MFTPRHVFHNNLIVLNIPKATAHLLEMACKAERAKVDGGFWLKMAEEVEGGKYLTRAAVDDLCTRFPFMGQFRN